MAVQQVDTTFNVRTKDLPGGQAAEFLATFLAGLIDYNNSFEIHEFSFKISFRTIWINPEEANRNVANFIRNLWECLGETFDIGEDQIQIDYQLDGRDLGKEALELVVRTGTVRAPTALGDVRNTNPYGVR